MLDRDAIFLTYRPFYGSISAMDDVETEEDTIDSLRADLEEAEAEIEHWQDATHDLAVGILAEHPRLVQRAKEALGNPGQEPFLDDDGSSYTTHHWAARLMARSFAKELHNPDGEPWNYRGINFIFGTGDSIEVFVQRSSGKTPAQVAAEYRQRAETAEARVLELEQRLQNAGDSK